MKVSFEYLGEDQEAPGTKFWKVDAIHVTTTGNKRKFTKAELQTAGRSLSFRPLDINHEMDRILPFPQNSTMEMKFDDAKMAVSGRIKVADHTINDQIESGFLRDVSIEQIPTEGESCNEISCEQHGVAFVGLALLEKGVMPGDPNARIIKNENISFTDDIINLVVSDEQRRCEDCSDFTACHKCKHSIEKNDECLEKAIHEAASNNPDWSKEQVLAEAITKCEVNGSKKEAMAYYERFTPLTEALVKPSD